MKRGTGKYYFTDCPACKYNNVRTTKECNICGYILPVVPDGDYYYVKAKGLEGFLSLEEAEKVPDKDIAGMNGPHSAIEVLGFLKDWGWSKLSKNKG